MNTFYSEKKEILPQLSKKSSTYKLIVPQNVEKKIRYLIQKYPHTEWSGVLFYTHEGSFENENLVITCQDIYPMDLGTSGWTEFKMTEEVASYLAENIELFDCETGLVHSHHGMGAFFSGQDVKMIAQEGNDTNCFVSLVVDTPGNYVAIVTRKISTEKEISIRDLHSSYEFFGEGSINLETEDSSKTHTIDTDIIEYFELEIERHTVECPPNGTLSYLDDRFNEIISKKTPVRNILVECSDWLDNFTDYRKHTKCSQPYLFDDETMQSMERTSIIDWTPDKKALKQAIVNIISCSLIVNSEKFDIKQWIKKHINNIHNKLFINENSVAFNNWKEFIITYILDNFDYGEIEFSDQFDDAYSILAQSIYDELFQYSENSPYIEGYCEELITYIF